MAKTLLTAQVKTRVGPEIANRLEALAARNDRSVAAELRLAIIEHLRRGERS